MWSPCSVLKHDSCLSILESLATRRISVLKSYAEIRSRCKCGQRCNCHLGNSHPSWSCLLASPKRQLSLTLLAPDRCFCSLVFGEPQLNWVPKCSHHVIAGKREELGLGICNVSFTGSFDWEGGLMPSHQTHNQEALTQETGFSWQTLLCLLADLHHTYVYVTLTVVASSPGIPGEYPMWVSASSSDGRHTCSTQPQKAKECKDFDLQIPGEEGHKVNGTSPSQVFKEWRARQRRNSGHGIGFGFILSTRAFAYGPFKL